MIISNKYHILAHKWLSSIHQSLNEITLCLSNTELNCSIISCWERTPYDFTLSCTLCSYYTCWIGIVHTLYRFSHMCILFCPNPL